MGSTTISQISCFSSINRELNLNRRKRFTMVAPFRTKFSVVMKLEGSGTETPSAKTNTSLRYASDASKLPGEEAVESYPTTEEPVAGSSEADVQVHEDGLTEPIKAAKIHDFCFGIPFGGLVLSGGFVGFLFSRNPSTLGFGMLYGGALLALSTFSLKIWRQGKSSLPFILGQAALAAALLWKHVQNYSLTKKIFPAGFYAVVSAAMVCFYSYVMLSGGNPPPKKKLQASPASPPS